MVIHDLLTAFRIIRSLRNGPNRNVEGTLLSNWEFTESDGDTISHIMSVHFPGSSVSTGQAVEVGPKRKTTRAD